MKKEMIRIKGARENNLKNIDLEVPRNQFVVVYRAEWFWENLLWHLIRFMQKGREDIWNHYLPMQDSFWGKWRNRMWKA